MFAFIKNNKIILALEITVIFLTPIVAHADVASTPSSLGTLGGTTSSAYRISDDASTIVGTSKITGDAADHAFRWTQATGMVDLGTLGGTYSQANGISGDGNIIVGISKITGDSANHTFRWTAETGMLDLGTLGGTFSIGYDVSDDGAVVIGYSSIAGNSIYHSFRWTEATGMVDLGTLGGTHSSSKGLSANGLVIVGESQTAGNASNNVFRWTAETGMVDLGTLGGTNAYGNNINTDASVIVGSSKITGDIITHGFRWSEATGMVDVGSIGGTYTTIKNLSEDGSILVGKGQTTGNTAWHAIRWTQETGMKDLNTLFTEAGIDMSTIELIFANGISSDGKYIVGSATFSGSPEQAYIACYDPASRCVGITTPALQKESVVELTKTQQQSMVGTRSSSNTLMGMAQPVMSVSSMSSEATMGSAMMSQNGQFVIDDEWTLLGGIAFGSNEYDNVERKNAYMFAGGVRYNLDRHINLGNKNLSPYVEVGGWYSPKADMSITRSYANGGGSGQGKGSTNSSSWSGYMKLGMVWDKSSKEQINSWIDIGQQAMSFDGYTERSTPNNPFPATMSSGTIHMGVARIGASYTIDVEQLSAKAMGQTLPASITFAGAIATSFGTSSDLKTTVAGAGTVNATPENNSWGEIAVRMETDLSEDWALSTSVSGTISKDSTSLHGGAGLSYKF